MRGLGLRGWRLARAVGTDARVDRTPRLAAELAFFSLLSLPPALLVVLGISGYIGALMGPGVALEIRDRLIDIADGFLTPQTVDELVVPILNQLLERGRSDVASIGVVILLWSASRATAILMETVRIAYDVPARRSALRRRAVAIAITVAGVVAASVLFPALVVGPRAIASLARSLGVEDFWADFWRVAYWPVLAVAGVTALTLLFHTLSERKGRLRADIPGAVLSLVLWVAGGIALRVYATWTFRTGSLYGPIAAPTVLLLWLYVTSLALLLGAELNGELCRRRRGAPSEERESRPQTRVR